MIFFPIDGSMFGGNFVGFYLGQMTYGSELSDRFSYHYIIIGVEKWLYFECVLLLDIQVTWPTCMW